MDKRAQGFLVLALSLAYAVPTFADTNHCLAGKLRVIAKMERALLHCQAKLAKSGDASGLTACKTHVMAKFSPAFDRWVTAGCEDDKTRCEGIVEACETWV